RSPASPGGSHRRIWTTARICTTPFSGSRSPSSRWYSRALWPDRPLLLRCQPRTIQLLDRFSRGLAELLEPGCSRLSRVKDAEQVFSGQLLQGSVAPPATDQFGEELGELGGIFQALRHRLDPIEVTPDPDVIDTGHVAHMLDVVGHLLERRPGLRMI